MPPPHTKCHTKKGTRNRIPLHLYLFYLYLFYLFFLIPTVHLLSAISSACSSVTSLSHTCDVEPPCLSSAVAVSIPSRFAFKWFALISMPKAISSSAIILKAPKLAAVSASTTFTPPCT